MGERDPGRSPEGEVLVIGEALIDTVVGAAGQLTGRHPGGSPANVALGLGRLGVPVRLRTALAHDANGESIATHLAASGVRVDPASYCLSRTAVARAVTAPGGSAHYFFDMEWWLPGAIDVSGVTRVHIGSIACFLEPGATAVEAFVKRVAGRIPISFDPNIRRQFVAQHSHAAVRVESLSRLASVVKLSDEDAAWLYPGEDVDAVLDRFLDFGARLVVVTQGSRGAVLASPTARVRLDAVTVSVGDSVGAGDSFMAGLIDRTRSTGIDELNGTALHSIGRYAAAAASVTVSRQGADLPWAAELVGL